MIAFLAAMESDELEGR